MLLSRLQAIRFRCLQCGQTVLKKQNLNQWKTYVAPFFIVTNLKTSVSFYVDKLGFEIRYIGPDDDPFYAMVGRDNISIMLKAIAPDVKPIPNHTQIGR